MGGQSKEFQLREGRGKEALPGPSTVQVVPLVKADKPSSPWARAGHLPGWELGEESKVIRTVTRQPVPEVLETQSRLCALRTAEEEEMDLLSRVGGGGLPFLLTAATCPWT